MSIQLFVVLSIFSSEKPARSYCQDLIKDLKASSPDGCVLSTVMATMLSLYHFANNGGKYGTPHDEHHDSKWTVIVCA